MTNSYTNLDARWLEELSETLLQLRPDQAWANEHNRLRALDSSLAEDKLARLKLIAQHIQGMDEKLAYAYSEGYFQGRNRHLAHSNITKAADESRPISPNLAEAMAQFKGDITYAEPKKQAHKETLTIEDLEL